MVALNAWDWEGSTVTFGPIAHILVENVKSNINELRILPGQKVFPDGSKVDCDIKDCIFENITGVYTFKLYCQPNITNAIEGTDDTSGTVGTISNLFFKNITFDAVQNAGFSNIPVGSLFEVCADCDGLYFEDISVEETQEKFAEKGLRFMNVGPLSATWKTNSSEDPAHWGEIFSPDAVCTVDHVEIKNLKFQSQKEQPDADSLVHAVRLSINEDYPNTTPKGGTGCGIVKEVKIID